MEYWPGETDCCFYQGIQKVTIKTCCGGRVKERVRLGCAIHKRIFAVECRKDLCGYYDRGGDDGGEDRQTFPES